MPRLTILNADEINAFEKPPKFTSAQREKYFHLSDKLSALKNKVTSDTSKLAIVIQWGYFRATGRFFLVSDFHVADVKYVAERLAFNMAQIDLKTYHENRKTARDHQKCIFCSERTSILFLIRTVILRLREREFCFIRTLNQRAHYC